MPGELTNSKSLSQYFSRGKPIFSPARNCPLDGVRTNITCPPLDLILSTAVFTELNIESSFPPDAGGSLLILPKVPQMALTWLLKLVSAAILLVIYSWRVNFTLPKSEGNPGK